MNQERNFQDKINIFTKFLWFCSGANSEILKRSATDRNKYATQGFAILLITIVGGFGGGYAISTVFTSRLVIYSGGALWGLVLGSMDRAMVSSFTKKTNSSWTEKIGDGVSLVVKLGISTLISLTVAKPLEVRMFEDSIQAQIAKNIEEELVRESEKINAKYDLQITKIEQEKSQDIQEKQELQQQIKKARQTYDKEVSEGNAGRKEGDGPIAKALLKSINARENNAKKLEAKIEKTNQEIKQLRAEKQKKFKQLEENIKQERTANDFVAQLHVLHQIQENEEKIFFGDRLGVYEATGWAITLLFVLIDTSPVLIKIFSRIDNYEKLLETAQEEEEISEKKSLENEGELLRYKNNIRTNNDKELAQESLDIEKKHQQKTNQLNSQEIDLIYEYNIKLQKITLEMMNSAKSLTQMRRIRNEYKRSFFSKNSLAFSWKEKLDKFNLSSRHFKNNVENLQDEFNSSKLQHSIQPIDKLQKKPEKVQVNLLTNLITTTGGLFAISCSVWISLEAIALSSLTINPMPFPKGANPHMVITADGKELKNPRSWKGSSRELELVEFSTHLKNALIASEDRRFYSHPGVDFKGLVRALVQTLKGNTQGGSTLSQQLAKKLFLDKEPNSNIFQRYRKKLRQILLAIRLEIAYDKNEILKTYLNRIYLGHQKGRPIIGFEEAAQFFFGKSAKDLNIAESAALVGMLPSPNASDPINNLEQARNKRDLRIWQMLDLKMISKKEAIKALDSNIVTRTQLRNYPETFAPYAYDRVRSELETIVGEERATSGQYIIETTINSNYQQLGEEALKKELEIRGAKKGYDQAALVTIDRKTGAILALVGGTGVNYPINYAANSKFPLASTMKLISYTVAIQAGISLSQKISCAPWKGKDGHTIPGCRQGEEDMTLEDSLAYSENVPIIRLVEKIGLEKIEALSNDLGLELDFASNKNIPGYFQQLILGTFSSTLLNVTNSYATIANQGSLNQPYLIKTIRDRCSDPEKVDSCPIVYSVADRSKSIVIASVAQKVMKMLRGVVTYGTASKALKTHAPELVNEYSTVGKTGTSSKNKNLWFIGTVPEKNITTGVWMGQVCINEPKRGKTCPSTQGNSSLAVTLWAKYMQKIL